MERPARLPHSPGCYLFGGTRQRMLYVGMATDLARRVSGYFGPPPRGRPRLVAAADSLQIILTRNAHEAAVLERNLVRRWRPRYNRAVPDENTGFWYLRRRATGDDRFPTFERYRPEHEAPVPEALRDLVFGPYLSYAAAEAILGYVTDRFRLRTCSVHGMHRCTRFDIGVCTPICDAPELEEEHAQQYQQAARFLRHPDPSVADQVRRLMGQAAERGDCETAARLRDRARLLERSLQPHAADVPGGGDCLVVAGEAALVVRSGRVEAVLPIASGTVDSTATEPGKRLTAGQLELSRLNAQRPELAALA